MRSGGGPPSGIVGLAWAPLALTMLRGGTDLVAAYVFAAVVGSGVLALAVDDEVIELTSSAPVPLAQRNGLRLAELLAVALAVDRRRRGGRSRPATRRCGPPSTNGPPRPSPSPPLSLSLASLLAGQRVPGAGLFGAISGSGAVALVAVLALRFDWLPGLLGAAAPRLVVADRDRGRRRCGVGLARPGYSSSSWLRPALPVSTPTTCPTALQAHIAATATIVPGGRRRPSARRTASLVCLKSRQGMPAA